MTVGAVVYNSANTGAPIASTNITSGGFDHGLLDAAIADPLNSDAEIKIQVHRNHPSISAFQRDRVVRIMNGAHEDAKFVVRKIEDQIVGDDASRELVTVSGRTLLSDFREVTLRNFSDLPSTSVAYNFAHPAFDDSGWSDAVTEVDRSALGGFVRPVGWFDPYTVGVWGPSHSAGSIFGRVKKTLPAGRYVGQIAADSGFRVYVNGVKTGDARSTPQDRSPFHWQPYRAFMLDLKAGTHTFAVEGVKQAGFGTAKATIWFAVWPVSNFKLGGDAVVVTGPTSDPNPYFAGWKWSLYPATRHAPPVTRIVTEYLSLAQADGALTDWTLGFTATKDSDGVDAPAHEWGMDLTRFGFDMLQSIATAGWLTFRVRPGAGKILDAYVGYGATLPLTYSVDDMLGLRRTVES